MLRSLRGVVVVVEIAGARHERVGERGLAVVRNVAPVAGPGQGLVVVVVVVIVVAVPWCPPLEYGPSH